MPIQVVLEFPANRRGDQSTALWEHLIGRAYDLRDHRRAANKGDDVAVTRDIDASGVSVALYATRSVNLKELGVNRSAENIQRVFCDGRSNR